MHSERWLPVCGYENSYEVSDHGRVRNLARTVRSGCGYRTVPDRVLAQTPVKTRRDGKSRKVVMLHNTERGLRRWARVPHLVLEAFVGPRPSSAHVTRHLNGDPSDNRLVNLVWGTHAENVADTHRLDHVWRGEQHGGAKLTVKQVKEIRKLRAAGNHAAAIATQFSISPPLVSYIAHRKAWKHV